MKNLCSAVDCITTLLRQGFEISEKQLLQLLQTCEVLESNVKEISEDPKTIHTFLCSKTKRLTTWILTWVDCKYHRIRWSISNEKQEFIHSKNQFHEQGKLKEMLKAKLLLRRFNCTNWMKTYVWIKKPKQLIIKCLYRANYGEVMTNKEVVHECKTQNSK